MLVQEVVEDQHLAARLADPRHLRHHPLGLGHHRDQVHRHDGVEAVVGELERARVHAPERDHVAQPLGLDLGLGLGEHLRREVDAGDLELRPIVPERQPGPDPDLENAAAAPVDVLDGPAAAAAADRAEGPVVDRRPAAVGCGDGLDVHRLTPRRLRRRRATAAVQASRPR